MNWSLLDTRGRRKYLTSNEHAAFIGAAFKSKSQRGSFCLTLALTGARISEVLALTPERIDRGGGAIVFETLKRRRRGVFRAVPVPAELISRLCHVHDIEIGSFKASTERLWQFSRPTAWKYVKAMMLASDGPRHVAKPKALRHAFGVEAVQQRIALSLVQKWLGHAKLRHRQYMPNLSAKKNELWRL
jgi:integrase/recombinase XerD